MKDPYETLGVDRSATDKDIKHAFKKLARKFHPDLHPGDKEAGKKPGKARGVAQSGSASALGAEGPRFESGRPDPRSRRGVIPCRGRSAFWPG